MGSSIGKRMMWALAAGLTHKMMRRATRRAMHTRYGAPRLPVAARKTRGVGSGLMWAAGTGAMLALSDVLREQEKRTVHRA